MLTLILEYRAEAQRIVGILLCLAALRWGGGPERGVAAVWLGLEGFDALYHLIFGSGIKLDEVDLGHAVLDVAATVAFVGIALHANRMYTLWVAALQIVATTAHLAREIAVMMKPIAYAVLAIGPSYFQLMLLAVGIGYHLRRSTIWGPYRDWRLKSPHGAIR